MRGRSSARDDPRRGLRRQLTALAVPLASTQLAAVVLAATSTAMMGPLGVTSLAAGGLSLVIFNQFRTIGTGLITSVGNEIASIPTSAAAAGTIVTSRRDTLRAGLLVATIAGVLGGVAIAASGRLLTSAGQDTEIAVAAGPFLVALAPGLLPVLWFQVLRHYAIATGRPQSILAITLVSIALNVALGSALVQGWGPLPSLGLTGIGIGSSTVQFCSFAALAVLVRLDGTLAESLSFRVWRAARGDVTRVVRHGSRIAATFGSSSFFYMTITLLMGGLSPLALAAHTVVYQVFSVGFQIANGLSQASSIVISRVMSARDSASAAYVNGVSVKSMTIVAALLGGFSALLPVVPLSVFSVDSASGLFGAARVLLVVALAAQIAEGLQNISVGVLRGFGDTSSSLRLSLVGYWVVGLPAALLLAFPLHLGAVGMWLGITLGLLFIAIALQLKIRSESRSTECWSGATG